LEIPDRPAVHAAARKRLVELAAKGLIQRERWDEFVRCLRQEASWRDVRQAAIAVLADAGTFPASIVIRDADGDWRGMFHLTESQRLAALAALREWASLPDSTFSLNAREALDAAIAHAKPHIQKRFLARRPQRKQSTYDGGQAEFTVACSGLAVAACRDLLTGFCKMYPDVRSNHFMSPSVVKDFSALAEGQREVMLYCPLGEPQVSTEKVLAETYADASWPDAYLAGYYVVLIAVNQANPIEKLDYLQLRDIFAGRDNARRWEQVGGTGGRITCYGEDQLQKSRDIVKEDILNRADSGGRRYRDFREDIVTCRHSGEVVARVAKDPSAIGYLMDMREDFTDKVKLLAISCAFEHGWMIDKAMPGKAYAPTKRNILQGRYPLAIPFTFYVPFEQTGAPRKFCEFAQGPEGGRILKRALMYTAYERAMLHIENRMEQYKAGQGQRLTAAGDGAWSAWVEALNVEYVKAAEVVQGRYVSVAGDTAQVGVLVRDKAELAIIAGGLSDEALGVHGADWRKLWAEAKRATPAPASTPGAPAHADAHADAHAALAQAHARAAARDGDVPAGDAEHVVGRHVLGARAVAICVHKLNELDALTVGQLRDLFSHTTQTWEQFGGGDEPVHRYGLAAREPAAAIFEADVLPADKCGPIKRMYTGGEQTATAAALEALAMDPQGVAFVDAAQIPADHPSIKVLQIVGERRGATAAAPTRATACDGRYPLARPVYLYVSPQASEAAKGFARFAATCGRSAANPYVDVPGRAEAAFRAHGLLPAPAPEEDKAEATDAADDAETDTDSEAAKKDAA
jgi:phosphate transport system substrate-binding protein